MTVLMMMLMIMMVVVVVAVVVRGQIRALISGRTVLCSCAEQRFPSRLNTTRCHSQSETEHSYDVIRVLVAGCRCTLSA